MSEPKTYPVNESFETLLRSIVVVLLLHMSSTYIYALSDPLTPDKIRYVGKSNDPKHRLQNHRIPLALTKTHHRANWIRSLEGRKPVLRILATVSMAGWERHERAWITRLRNAGHDLVNTVRGGEGGATYGHLGRKHSEETKRRISEAKKGIKVGDKIREQMSVSARAAWDKKCTEQRKAMGAKVARARERNGTTNRGRTFSHSAETRLKMSQAAKARLRTAKGRLQLEMAAHTSAGLRRGVCNSAQAQRMKVCYAEGTILCHNPRKLI